MKNDKREWIEMSGLLLEQPRSYDSEKCQGRELEDGKKHETIDLGA
jgi:hypothetical protein